MPMPSFANHQVTITEPGSRLVHGSPVPDWSPAKVTTRTLDRCLVQPFTTEESDDDPDTVRDAWKILLPGHEEPPTSAAKIIHQFSPDAYQVVGKPMPQPGTRAGSIDHWFLACEKWRSNG